MDDPEAYSSVEPEEDAMLREEERQAMMGGRSFDSSVCDTVSDEDRFFKICCRVYQDHPYHHAVYRWLSGMSRNKRGLDKISAHMVAALNLYVDVLEGRSQMHPVGAAPMSPPVPSPISPVVHRLRDGFSRLSANHSSDGLARPSTVKPLTESATDVAGTTKEPVDQHARSIAAGGRVADGAGGASGVHGAPEGEDGLSFLERLANSDDSWS